MIPKYTVDYSILQKKNPPVHHFATDDPVACEEFLTECLERGIRIADIKHEGVALGRPDFDRMVKNAASMLASRHICAALGIDAKEEKFRFGFAA